MNSDSMTSTSENSNKSKNSDMSYHFSTNDDTTSYSSNKINEDRRNQRKSTKYIQPILLQSDPNNNNTNSASPTSNKSKSKTSLKEENNTNKLLPTSEKT